MLLDTLSVPKKELQKHSTKQYTYVVLDDSEFKCWSILTNF